MPVAIPRPRPGQLARRIAASRPAGQNSRPSGPERKTLPGAVGVAKDGLISGLARPMSACTRDRAGSTGDPLLALIGPIRLRQRRIRQQSLEQVKL